MIFEATFGRWNSLAVSFSALVEARVKIFVIAAAEYIGAFRHLLGRIKTVSVIVMRRYKTVV